MQRFRYAEKQIQEAEDQRLEYMRIKQQRQVRAVLVLQAWARGLQGRQMAVWMQLENRLECIQSEHRRELQDIVVDLSRRKVEFRKSYEVSLRREERQLKSQAGAKLREIRELKSQNTSLRLSNKKIKLQKEELHETNHQLELQTAALEIEIRKAKEYIAELQHQNQKWETVEELYQKQVDKYRTAHEGLEEMIGEEKRANVHLQSTMVHVLETMESAQREDPEEVDLFQTTLAMAARAPWRGQSSHRLPLIQGQTSCSDLEHSAGDLLVVCGGTL